MTYQFFPPDDHRRNITKKCWKDCFVCVLSFTATIFLLYLWCQAIPQAERQLLLMRQSNVYPIISASIHLYVQNDYNATLFVPVGIDSLFMKSLAEKKTLLSTAKSVLFSEHYLSIIAPELYG